MMKRRSFLKWAAALLGGFVILVWGLLPKKGKKIPPIEKKPISHRDKLIFISIDGLHPNYLELDAKGLSGGRDGDWLMPNLRALLGKALWYKNAKAFLPSATDMNHLNVLAGTSSAQTGIIGVWAQPTGWSEKGEAIVKQTSLSFAKDDKGRPVDTLFHAWKRRWPDSKTLLITGKEWVGEMFRQEGTESVIDLIVTGPDHPDYLYPPEKESLSLSKEEKEAACVPESKRLGFFDGPLSLNHILTRTYTGQRSLLRFQMEYFANHFPRDKWVVDSTLEIFKREDPDMAYVLLAQCDDAGHCIGNASDPAEFIKTDRPYEPSQGCEDKPEYRLVSIRNKLLYKETILNVVRHIDIQIGRLMGGLERQQVLDHATVIFLSDHSAVNHLYTEDFSSTDMMSLLEDAGIVERGNVYAFSVSSYGCLYWRNHKEQVQRAKALLQSHRAFNPQTGEKECPWWVLDRKDMKEGIEGICQPGELYHPYYIDIDKEKTMIWPDLIILGKNGWQIPVYNGHVPNVGINPPKWMPPWRLYIGGHGSVDTLPIVAAISVPGGKMGINNKPIRIADLGVTAGSLFGLKLNSTMIGEDLSKDLV